MSELSSSYTEISARVGTSRLAAASAPPFLHLEPGLCVCALFKKLYLPSVINPDPQPVLKGKGPVDF